MDEGGREEQEKKEYKDHYKMILEDLIGRRNSPGFLENEEAIEGTVSNGMTEEVFAACSSHQENPILGSNAIGGMSMSTTGRHNLSSSLQQTLMDNTDDSDDLAVFQRKILSPEPGNGAYPAVSDNQLLDTDDRKTPEGDLAPSVLPAAPEVCVSSLTPELSMMSLTGDRRADSGTDDGRPSTVKKKWKILKGFKNSLFPK